MTSDPGPGAGSVDDLVATLDEATAADTRTLMDLMHRISGAQPAIWNVGTIGYDSYHFAYDSGREGDGHALGFYPRKGRTTVYLMDGTDRHTELLAQLGKHTTSRVCLYLKRLGDVDLGVLEEILRSSYAYLKENDGNVKRV
jgi:hypothetical protein